MSREESQGERDPRVWGSKLIERSDDFGVPAVLQTTAFYLLNEVSRTKFSTIYKGELQRGLHETYSDNALI